MSTSLNSVDKAPMNRFTLITLLLVILAALAGCGQKGDLYLPDEDEPPSRHLLDDPDDKDEADDTAADSDTDQADSAQDSAAEDSD